MMYLHAVLFRCGDSLFLVIARSSVRRTQDALKIIQTMINSEHHEKVAPFMTFETDCIICSTLTCLSFLFFLLCFPRAQEDSDSDSDSSDEDSDSDSAEEKVAKKGANDSDSEDSYVSETDSSDSDNDYQNRSSAAAGSSAAGGRKVLVGRARWLKSDKVKEVAHAARLDTQAARVLKQQAQQTGVAVKPKEAPKIAKVEDKNAVRVPDTEEELQKRLNELMASRGRKGTDPREVLRKLEVLARGSRKFGPRMEIPVLMHLVSSMYDGARGIDDYMEVQPWRTCYRCLLRITNILNANKKLSLVLMSAEDATDLFASKLSLMKKEGEESATPNVDPNVIRVVGSLGAFIQRLEDEYTKALQQINPHTSVSAFLSDRNPARHLANSRMRSVRCDADVTCLS